MKTIICFENEELSCRYHSLLLGKIRQRYKEEQIILISAGDFSSAGELLTPSDKERSAHYVKAGASLVLSLPMASVLGGYGKKEFAGAALVQRLRAAEVLVIPCRPMKDQTLEDCGKLLKSYAMRMFTEADGYRGRLSEYLRQNMLYRKAQVKAVCNGDPQVEELLSCPENRFALWLLDAMLQLYYMAKVEFISSPWEETDKAAGDAAAGPEDCRANAAAVRAENAGAFDQAVVSGMRDLLASCSREDLIDIAGSTEQMVDALLKKKDAACTASSLEEIALLLAPASPERARLFLLKALLRLRKIYMQICGLHVYVPYAYITAAAPDHKDFLRHLTEEAWVLLIADAEQSQQADQEYHYLLEADLRAAALTDKSR